MVQVFQIERERVELKTGKTTHEIVEGLTSLPLTHANAHQLLGRVRDDCRGDNGLYHRRDVTSREDAAGLTRGNAGRVMTILNNLVIGLLSWHSHRNHGRARCVDDACLTDAFALDTDPS